jgi:electron transfer flavoprotein alpha subunit
MNMSGNVLFFAEQRNGKLKNVAREVAAVGRALADQLGVELEGVLIGAGGLEQLAGELAECGLDTMFLIENSALENYSGSAFASSMQKVVQEREPAIVLLGASSMGKDLAPRLASRLGVGLASDCTAIGLEGSDLIATRPVYAGKTFMRIKVKGTPAMAALRPKAFPVPDQLTAGNGAVEKIEIDLAEQDLKDRVVELVGGTGGAVDLTEADIVVSAGRGIKGPENFTLIEDLAKELGGVVGASRAVVDAGWRPHSDQVGQTGKVVSPTLYIACGISGAIQHLAGMNSSRFIVAINKDSEAPIFKLADYGIVGDLFEVVPRLTEEVKKLKD